MLAAPFSSVAKQSGLGDSKVRSRQPGCYRQLGGLAIVLERKSHCDRASFLGLSAAGYECPMAAQLWQCSGDRGFRQPYPGVKFCSVIVGY